MDTQVFPDVGRTGVIAPHHELAAKQLCGCDGARLQLMRETDDVPVVQQHRIDARIVGGERAMNRRHLGGHRAPTFAARAAASDTTRDASTFTIARR